MPPPSLPRNDPRLNMNWITLHEQTGIRRRQDYGGQGANLTFNAETLALRANPTFQGLENAGINSEYGFKPLRENGIAHPIEIRLALVAGAVVDGPGDEQRTAVESRVTMAGQSGNLHFDEAHQQ